MNRDTFPEAVLNGQQLDLFALYREVATRGGFKCAAYIPPCNHPVIVFIFPCAHTCSAPLFTRPSGVSACMVCAQVHRLRWPKEQCGPTFMVTKPAVELVLGAAAQAGQRHQLEVAGVHADAQLDQGQQHDRRRECAEAPLPGLSPLCSAHVALARLRMAGIVPGGINVSTRPPVCSHAATALPAIAVESAACGRFGSWLFAKSRA